MHKWDHRVTVRSLFELFHGLTEAKPMHSNPVRIFVSRISILHAHAELLESRVPDAAIYPDWPSSRNFSSRSSMGTTLERLNESSLLCVRSRASSEWHEYSHIRMPRSANEYSLIRMKCSHHPYDIRLQIGHPKTSFLNEISIHFT